MRADCAVGPAIGHLRSGVNYDVLCRWLLRSGYQVTLIRNITDIDDKVLAKAAEAGRPFWSIAYGNERLLAETYQALNVLPPPTSLVPPDTSPRFRN